MVELAGVMENSIRVVELAGDDGKQYPSGGVGRSDGKQYPSAGVGRGYSGK